MDIQAFETLILSELKTVTEEILKNNPQPKISAKSRAGAEISSLLEEEFVKYTAIMIISKNPWQRLVEQQKILGTR